MEDKMNQDISEKKISFLASRISGFNSFLFWFGKKVYSILLGLIFIIFIGAGLYAYFVDGDDISVPSFEDGDYENIKDIKLAEIKEQERISKLSGEEKEKERQAYEKKQLDAKNVVSGRKDLEEKHGKDIKEFIKRHSYQEKLYDSLINNALSKPEDERDDWLEGFIEYLDDGYKYFSKDDIYEIFREQNGWKEKWDINNWLWKQYDDSYAAAKMESSQSKALAESTVTLSLQVMGGSFLAFLIAVLIVIFIQIEANTRPVNNDRT
jgi:hypothetical protein